MKKIISMLMAIACIITTACQELDKPTPPETIPMVNVSFVSEPNQSLTKAFFDPSTTTEAWEKNLSSLTILAFDNTGALLIQREFTAEELTAKKSSFAIPRTAAGKSCDFYAIANKTVTGVITKTGVVALLENSAADYNSTFDEVSTKTKRTGGFVMSGTINKTVAEANQETDIAITLKRTVAKIAVQASLAPDFSNKYSGSVKINSAMISKAAMQTPLIATTPNTGTMNYSHTQNTKEVATKFNNLFYIYENGNLSAGSRVFVTLEGIYDRDGNFTTTTDQIPVTYEFELNGTTNTGALMRNGYYRIAVSLTGLTGQDVNAVITVAEWETPITQNISIGK